MRPSPAWCLLAFILPLVAEASEWSIAPRFSVGSIVNHNPGLTVAGQDRSALGADVFAGADISRRMERLEVRMTPTFAASRYDSRSNFDTDDQALAATVMGINERSTWALNASAVRDTTLTSELGTTGRTDVNRRRQTLSLGFGPQWQLTERWASGLQAGWVDSRYVGTGSEGLVDYRYTSLAANVSYGWSERSQLGLIASIDELSVSQSGRRIRNFATRLQFVHQFAPRWDFSLSGGPALVNSDSATERGWVFDTRLNHRSELSVVSFSAERKVSPNGLGLLTRREAVSLDLERRLTEHMSVSGGFDLIRSEDLLPVEGIVFNSVEYKRVEAALTWRLTEYWRMSAVASGSQQTSRADRIFRLRDDTGNGWNMALRFAWNGPQRLL